jgi:hypothetical protein
MKSYITKMVQAAPETQSGQGRKNVKSMIFVISQPAEKVEL